MKVEFIHVCDYAVVDQAGKLSVLGIFDRVIASAFPVVLPQIFVAFETAAVGGEVGRPHRLKIQIVDPDGTTLFSVEGDIVIDGSKGPAAVVKATHAVKFNQLVIQKPGPHGVWVFLNDALAGQKTIEVGAQVATGNA